jgi:hypothetical protein
MRRLILLLAALSVFIPVSARADDAAALLAKHKAFAGWQFGDGSLRSMIVDSKMTNSSNVTVYTEHDMRLGLAERVTRTGKDGATSDSGFTGRVFWATNHNGFTYPTLGSEKFAVAQSIIFNEVSTGLPGAFRGTQTIDGSIYDVVRVQASKADAIDLYVDPQTGAYRRAVIDPGGSEEATLDILAYSEIAPGKKIISQWKWRNSKYSHAVTHAVANAELTPDELHPPQQTAKWSFASGEPIPLHVRTGDPWAGDRQNHRLRGWFVDAIIDGVKGEFMIDTGADGIVLNSAFVGRLHPKRIGTAYAYGVGGSVKSDIERVDRVQIGGNTLHNVYVNEDRLDDDPNYGGLIGFDLFAGAIVSLDLDNGQLTLFDPSNMQPDESKGLTLTVDLTDGQPWLPMSLNKNVPINAMLDSGDLVEVTLAEDLRSKYHVAMLVDPDPEHYNLGHRLIRGVAGEEVMECGTVGSITIGPIDYASPPSCFTRTVLSNNQAVVGFDFLQHFNFVFDYSQAKIILIPRHDSN